MHDKILFVLFVAANGIVDLVEQMVQHSTSQLMGTRLFPDMHIYYVYCKTGVERVELESLLAYHAIRQFAATHLQQQTIL